MTTATFAMRPPLSDLPGERVQKDVGVGTGVLRAVSEFGDLLVERLGLLGDLGI
jgi:hypothetical protein